MRMREGPSGAFLYQGERVDHPAILPDLEMQVRGTRAARVARQPDDLTGAHLLAHRHQDAGQVAIETLVSLRVLYQDVDAVLGVWAGLDDGSSSSDPAGPRRCPKPSSSVG